MNFPWKIHFWELRIVEKNFSLENSFLGIVEMNFPWKIHVGELWNDFIGNSFW